MKPKEDVEELLNKLISANQQLRETHHGLDENRPAHEQNRRKRQNKKRAAGRKKTRKNQGPLSFINAICAEPMSSTCFPNGFECHEKSDIEINNSHS